MVECIRNRVLWIIYFWNEPLKSAENVFFPKKTTFFLIIEAIMIRLFALWPVLGADAIEIFTVSEKKLDFLQASTFCNSKNAKLLSPKLLPDVRSENNIILISFHKNYRETKIFCDFIYSASKVKDHLQQPLPLKQGHLLLVNISRVHYCHPRYIFDLDKNVWS